MFKNLPRTQILHVSSSLLVSLGWVRQKLPFKSVTYFKRNTKKPVIFIEQKQKLSEVCSEILRKIDPLAPKLTESHDVVSIAKWRFKELDEKKVIVLDNAEGIHLYEEQLDDFLEYVGSEDTHLVFS